MNTLDSGLLPCIDDSLKNMDNDKTIDLNNQAFAAGQNISLELPDNGFEWRGQHFMVEPAFDRILNDTWVSRADLLKIAESICNWLQSRGLMISQKRILFAVDRIAGPPDSPFFYCRSEANIGPLAIICVNSRSLNETIQEIRAACARLEKRTRRKLFKSLVSSSVRIKLSHELAHAFGLNSGNERLAQIPIPDLELLTDACAYLSCEKMAGETAHLGVPYLQERLEQQGIKLAAEATRQLAKNVVATQAAGGLFRTV